MLKIAIDCRMFKNSGIGTFTKGILEYLVKDKRIRLLLIGDKQILKPYKTDSVEILDNSIKPFSLKELFLFPVKDINKCDCFFSPNYNLPSGIRVPIFSTIHDVLFLDYPELKGYIGRFLRREAIKRAIKLSTHIFTVSEFSKSRLLYHYPNFNSISVCYNGAENINLITDFHDKNLLSEEYYLFIGNIKPHKGLNILLDAYERINNKTNRKLVIVGQQHNFLTSDNSLSQRLMFLSETEKILFTGYVDQPNLINLIKNAYCLIQPSIYEGFGLPPLEAMHIGTPVILSNIPVFKELFSDFPVKFFKSKDPDSLANAMLGDIPRVSLSPEQIGKFSYKNTANIILSDIITYFK